MAKNKGYGVIEVLVSASIFLVVTTSANVLLSRVLIHAREIEELHFILRNTSQLIEQLHMFSEYDIEDKRALIQCWNEKFQQQVSGYNTEVIEQLTTVQIKITQKQFKLILNVII